MHTMTPAGTRRVAAIDRLRGLAIVLMIVDHVIVAAAPASGDLMWIRLTATRLSFPLFCFAAAAVASGPPSRRRAVQLFVVSLVEFFLGAAVGLGVPGPVFVIGVGLVLAPYWQRRPLTFATVGLIQALYVPVPLLGLTWWSGYQPGLAWAWLVLGHLAWREWAPIGDRLPRVLGAIGARPLVWYVGHLCALAFAFGAPG